VRSSRLDAIDDEPLGGQIYNVFTVQDGQDHPDPGLPVPIGSLRSRRSRRPWLAVSRVRVPSSPPKAVGHRPVASSFGPDSESPGTFGTARRAHIDGPEPAPAT
jgi:hypothetical protein